MPELHTLTTEANLPYYSFYHSNGKEYVIHASLVADEANQIDQINLSEVIFSGGNYKPGLALTAIGAKQVYIDYVGSFDETVEKFLVRVNKYLAENGGGGEPTTFPELGTLFERWSYLLNRGFIYANGKVLLVA